MGESGLALDRESQNAGGVLAEEHVKDAATGRRRRVLMLLFQGEDAVRKTRSVVGNVSPDRRVGETIRDTYGDLIIDEHDQLRYFEPAVLAAPTLEEAEQKLKLWAHHSDTDGGVLVARPDHGSTMTGE